MSISLCTFVKNEAHCLYYMVESVEDYIDEIVVVDTGSTDGTIEVCKAIGARVYQVGFTDFGSIRTITSHLGRKDWILMLDADETLTGANLLKDIAASGPSNAYAFPRRRWLDVGMEHQTELEVYPDLQVRFYRNNPEYVWRRELHEYFHGTAVDTLVDGPIIEHFHDVFKDAERLQERNELYTRLARRAGVTTEGGKPV